MSLSKSRFIEMFESNKFKKEPLKNSVQQMFIGPFGSSLKNDCFVPKRDAFCMVYEQKHAINKTMNLETRYVNRDKFEELKRFTVLPGDLIVSCRGTIGEVFEIPPEAPLGIMHPSIMKIRLKKDKYDQSFFIHLLRKYLEEHKYSAKGTSVKMAIKASDLEKELFILPSLTQQRAYVSFVDQIDKSKFLLQKILEKLELLKKSRFIEMFGDPIKNEKRWPQLTLDSVCDGIGDGLHGTPEYDDLGSFYFINGNNLINGTIVITPSTKRVNETTYKKYFTNISSNALLLSINGTLGKIAFYNDEAITLGKSACYINLKSFVNRYFVFELMRTDPFLKYLEENSTKSTIKNVSLKTIRNFKLISPPEILQNDFVAFSKQIDKSKLVIQKSLEDLVGKS